MRRGLFVGLLVGLVAIGLLALKWQRIRLQEERLALSTARKEPSEALIAPPRSRPSPSLELLRLRNEITMLNQELRAATNRVDRVLPDRARTDWEEIHSGPRLSEQPGFVSLTNLAPAGNATPAAAFQTFEFVMRNQHKEPLTPTRMKEIWDLLDDFDDPNARYSINIGQGIGGETGYRIVREESRSTNEVVVTVDFETLDGGTIQQEKVFAYRDGKWRLKPASVTSAGR